MQNIPSAIDSPDTVKFPSFSALAPRTNIHRYCGQRNALQWPRTRWQRESFSFSGNISMQIELRWKCSKTSLIQLHGWISSAAFLLLLLFRFNVFSLHSSVYLCSPVIVNVARRSCSTVCPFWIETVSTEHWVECIYYIIIYWMPSSTWSALNMLNAHARSWLGLLKFAELF